MNRGAALLLALLCLAGACRAEEPAENGKPPGRADGDWPAMTNELTGGMTTRLTRAQSSDRPLLLLKQVAALGQGRLESQPDGSFTSGEKTGGTAAPSITVSEKPIEDLFGGEKVRLPELRLTLRAGPELDSPEIRKLELGLPGDALWLVHDDPEAEEPTTGIELRTDW